MAFLKSYYGTETRVFLTTHLMSNGYMGIVELQTPLRSSISEYLNDCKDIFAPVHIFFNPEEGLIFSMALTDIANYSLRIEKDTLYRIYYNILLEHNIDLKAELRTASYRSNDDEAREYLRQINLQLRNVVDDFQAYYNSPKRLFGQKGALRKPKNINPVRVNWPDE